MFKLKNGIKGSDYNTFIILLQNKLNNIDVFLSVDLSEKTTKNNY